jgi:hypothetical protein
MKSGVEWTLVILPVAGKNIGLMGYTNTLPEPRTASQSTGFSDHVDEGDLTP